MKPSHACGRPRDTGTDLAELKPLRCRDQAAAGVAHHGLRRLAPDRADLTPHRHPPIANAEVSGIGGHMPN